VVARQSDKRPW
jgi:integrase